MALADARVEIREAIAVDASALAYVEVTTWQVSYAAMLPARTLASMSHAGARARWVRVLGTPMREAIGAVVVAEIDGAIIGFASGGARRGPARMARLDMLYVLPTCQRHGVGRALLRAFAQRMSDAGVTAMWLEVLARNTTGRRFYRAMGGAELSRTWRFIGTTPVVVVDFGWSLPGHLAAMG